MTRLLVVIAMAGVALAGVPAPSAAQSTAKADSAMEEGGRYSFHRAGPRIEPDERVTGAME